MNVEPTTPVLYHGGNNLTEIELSIWVVCPPDFTGARCETAIDNCIDLLSNCSGNGQCVDGNGTFTCDCWPGYTGEYCETDIDECLIMSGNCSNNGMCIDGINSFTCICESGYTGLRCETAISKSDTLMMSECACILVSLHDFSINFHLLVLASSSKGLIGLRTMINVAMTSHLLCLNLLISSFLM